MPKHSIAQVEALLEQGFEREARALLVEIVDADSGNGEAWFLLSRLAENPAQRVRFLQNAQRTGYLDSTVPIDAAVIQSSLAEAPEQLLRMPRTRSAGGAPSAEATVIKGGCLAVGLVVGCGLLTALVGGSFSINLGAIILIFGLGSVVALWARRKSA